jgi:NTE family protein
MAVALVLGGGAPNLTLMAGAVAALSESGVKFDIVSASGAGMLIGLLYAAPKGGDASQALRQTVNMGVHDAIYDRFPVNYKVFHKPGAMAETYTRFWQQMVQRRGELEQQSRRWMESATEAFLPGAALAPYRAMWKQFIGGMLPPLEAGDDTQRFVSDMTALMLAACCPSDLTPASQGMCQPAPFIDQVVDFSKLKDYPGEFYLNAYCIEDRKMALFRKHEIDRDHFQAALAFPFIYAPFKLNGKTYLEGATQDTLNFKGLYEYRKDKDHPPIETIVVCDVLGMQELIGEPRNLYDAWIKSIIAPLVAVAEDDLKLFEKVHKGGIPEQFGQPEPKLLKIDFSNHMPKDHWPNVLDWSYSNLTTLYKVGYAAGKAFYEKNRNALVPVAVRSERSGRPPKSAVSPGPSAQAGRVKGKSGIG